MTVALRELVPRFWWCRRRQETTPVAYENSGTYRGAPRFPVPGAGRTLR